jgi:hypothetical protein
MLKALKNYGRKPIIPGENLTTEEEPAPPALDKEAAYKLWTKSVEMTGVEDIIGKI